MPDYPTPPVGGSQADADKKNARMWSPIIGAIAILVHVLILTGAIAKEPGANLKAHPWAIVFPIVFGLYLLAVLYSFLKDAWWVTQSNKGWMVLIALCVASLWGIGFCLSC